MAYGFAKARLMVISVLLAISRRTLDSSASDSSIGREIQVNKIARETF
jgi:hypothetical protein